MDGIKEEIMPILGLAGLSMFVTFSVAYAWRIAVRPFRREFIDKAGQNCNLEERVGVKSEIRPNQGLYGDEYKAVELNGRIGKGLTVEDYAAAVSYLDTHAQRIHPREEPHWPHFHERGYLLHGVAVTVPEPLGMLRVEGYPPAVNPVVEQLMADLPFLKRSREVDVK